MASIGSDCPPAAGWKAAIHELIRGRELAVQLGFQLQEALSTGGHRPGTATMVLVEGVLGSFSRALSVLDTGERPETRQVLPDTTLAASPCSGDRQTEDSGGKWKAHPTRRGAHRRCAHPYSWRVTSKTLDDGHSWRKYGQKEIFCAKFPRSYFRCTRKTDQGCRATRQVQRSEDDPSLFFITYIGRHTCRDLTTAMASPHKTSYLISFGSNGARREPPLSSSSTSPNQELDEGLRSHVLPHVSSSSDHSVLPDRTSIGGREPSELEVGPASDRAYVTSGSHSPTSTLQLDLMADSFELDGGFSFDHEEIFRDYFDYDDQGYLL